MIFTLRLLAPDPDYVFQLMLSSIKPYPASITHDQSTSYHTSPESFVELCITHHASRITHHASRITQNAFHENPCKKLSPVHVILHDVTHFSEH